MPKQARPKPSTEIRNLKKRTGVFDSTFIPNEVEVTPAQAAAVARAIERQFNSWWDSWIEPELQYLEKRGF